MFRLAAFDLDNTLIGPDLTLSPRVREAVARAMAQGVVVTIATGRGIVHGHEYVLENWGLSSDYQALPSSQNAAGDKV